MPNLLFTVYEKLFGEEFDYGSFEDRLRMQKAVYLLENMGVNLGEFGFVWYKHGPYSQELQDEVFYLSNNCVDEDVNISPYKKKKIELLKDLVNKYKHIQTRYNLEMWLETLASLHYLKNNILSYSRNSEEIIRDLQKRKPTLDDKNANRYAFSLLEEDLFA